MRSKLETVKAFLKSHDSASLFVLVIRYKYVCHAEQLGQPTKDKLVQIKLISKI